MELTDLNANTSRRTIVKTGAKLAYMTPLVAASYKLGVERAGAVSGGGCGPSGCYKEAVCGAFSACEREGCQCWFTTSGETHCFQTEGADCGATTKACQVDTECPDGYLCAHTCCGSYCYKCCDGGTETKSSSANAANPNNI